MNVFLVEDEQWISVII